jgi:hypothetical protein
MKTVRSGHLWTSIKAVFSHLRTDFQAAWARFQSAKANINPSVFEILVSEREILGARECWGIILGNPTGNLVSHPGDENRGAASAGHPAS